MLRTRTMLASVAFLFSAALIAMPSLASAQGGAAAVGVETVQIQRIAETVPLFAEVVTAREGKIASRIAHLEASIERYLEEMVRTDRQEEGEARAEKIANLAQRSDRIRQEIQRLKDMDRALKESPDSQISLIDPDSRSMATSASI